MLLQLLFETWSVNKFDSFVMYIKVNTTNTIQEILIFVYIHNFINHII